MNCGMLFLARDRASPVGFLFLFKASSVACVLWMSGFKAATPEQLLCGSSDETREAQRCMGIAVAGGTA